MATSDNDRVSSTRLKEFADSLATRIKGIFYKKPSTGIPKDDLASDVQTSLTNADTHVADTDIHITAAERTAWNGKVDNTATGLKGLMETADSINPANADIIVAYNSTSAKKFLVSALWTYIQGKISDVLGLTSAAYKGTAAKATKADSATTAESCSGNAATATGTSEGSFDSIYIRKDGTNDDDDNDKNPSGLHRILWCNTAESYSAQNTGDYFVYINGEVSSTSYAQKINAENLSKVMQSCIESRNTLKAYSATTAEKATSATSAETAKNCSGTAQYAVQAGTCSGNSATATYAAFASNLTNNGLGNSSFNSLRPDDSNDGKAILKIYVTEESLGASILCSTRSPSGYPLVFSIAFTWSSSGTWAKVPKMCYLYTTSQNPSNTEDLGTVEVKYGTTTMTIDEEEKTVGTIFVRLPYSSSVSGSGSTGNRIFSLVCAKNAESIYFEEVNATDTDYTNATGTASGEGTVCTNNPGTAKGSTSKPVYVNSSGFVTECGFNIEIKSSGTISTDANTITFVTFSS